MGTDLRRRLTNLERSQGEPGPWCVCSGDIQVVWPDGEPVRNIRTGETKPPPPETCDRCGKAIRSIHIKWYDGIEDGDA